MQTKYTFYIGANVHPQTEVGRLVAVDKDLHLFDMFWYDLEPAAHSGTDCCFGISK